MGRDLLSSIWRAAEPPQLAPRDWEDLLAQARAARLIARLAALYRDRGWLDSAVPASPRQHLHSALRFAERLRHEVLFETDMIAAALAGVPTPVVLLKGAAYVAAGLPPGRERLFSDVDILVRRDRLDAVEAALMGAGWIGDKLDPYDDRYYRDYMHELPPLKHVRRNSLLDVHHTIAPPTSRTRIDGTALLARARPIPGAPGLSMLEPADMVLHSVLHLMQEGQFSGGLRDLLDIDDLLRHFGAADAGFWPDLLRRAGAIGTGAALVDALAQIERLFGPRVPADVRPALQTLAPSSLQRRLMTRLLAVALRPDHPSADDGAASAACRWLLYVRSHWLRMPWYQIGPHLARKWVTRRWASLQRLSSSSRTNRTGIA